MPSPATTAGFQPAALDQRQLQLATEGLQPHMQYGQAAEDEIRKAQMECVKVLHMQERQQEFVQHEVRQAMKQGALMPGSVNLRQPARMPPTQLEEAQSTLWPAVMERMRLDEEKMREAYLHKQRTQMQEQQMEDQQMAEQKMLQQKLDLQDRAGASHDAAFLQHAAQVQETAAMEENSQQKQQEMQRLAEEARQMAEKEEIDQQARPEAAASNQGNAEDAQPPLPPEGKPSRTLYEVVYKTYNEQEALTMDQLLQLNRTKEEEQKRLQRKYAEKGRRMEELMAEKARILAMEEQQAVELAELQEAAKKQEKQMLAVESQSQQEALEQTQYIQMLEQELQKRQQQLRQQTAANMANVQQQQAAAQMAGVQPQQQAAAVGMAHWQQQPQQHQHAAHMLQQQQAAFWQQQQQAAHMGQQQQAAAQMAGVQPQQAAPTTPRMPYVGEPIIPTPHTMFFRRAEEGADGQPVEKRGVQGHTQLTPEPCHLKD